VKSSGIGFKPLPKLEELRPGMTALGLRVLVLSRELQTEIEVKGPDGTMRKFEIAKTAGGDLQRQDEAGSEGMLVSVGMKAGYERWPKLEDGTPDYAGGHPRLGDIVCFARYSGKHAEFTGDDGRTYRTMNDEDVLLVRQPGSNAQPALRASSRGRQPA